MCVNHVWKPCLLRHSPKVHVFSNIQNPKQGFLGVLHDWDPRWGPPETTPHFAQSEKKVKSALWGFELKSGRIFGVGKIFVCDRDFLQFFFGSSVKKVKKSEKNVCDRGLSQGNKIIQPIF